MKKMADIQLIKVLAIMMVVYGHIICQYTVYAVGSQNIFPLYDVVLRFFAQIHTTSFTYCAGFIFGLFALKGKYSNFNAFCKKKVLRIFVPFIIFGGLRALIASDKFYMIFFSYYHVWYLLMLFECFLLIWPYHFYIKNQRLDLLLSLLLALPLLKFFEVTSFLSLRGFVCQFPFFFYGYMMAKYDILSYLNKKVSLNQVGLMGAFAAIFLLSICIFSNYGRYTDLFSRIYWHTPVLACCVILLTHIFLHRLGFRSYKLLDFLDSNSYRLYLIHPFIIMFVSQHILSINTDFTVSIVIFVLVVAITLVISHLISKTYLKKII